ncbi:MAG: crossover junction endodeoxyribonuclease RuvC [Candidatus Aminicenantes bacterium]|nr:crossover junction endodeoxyribonuclease RuvC [Candidatus Aminicenantes bacterium]
MVLLGFDPGSVCFGIGILKKENGTIRYVHSEEIKLKEKQFNARMKTLWKRLDEIFSIFSINEAAIEEGFLGKNISSMNVLAKVRGVVLGFLILNELDLISYSPRQVKLAVTGNGNALKSQVKRTMEILLQIKEKKIGNDESDALAVAYCHLLKVK